MKRKIILFILLILISINITGCQKDNREELILVTEAGFAPYEYYQNGEIVGVDIDIVKEIAKRLNKKLIIKDVAFDSIINEVRTGKSDIGAAGISYTEERAKQVDFTVNYYESNQVIIVNENSSITGPKDLYYKKIAVQLGSVADSYLTENYLSSTLIREKKYLAAIEDLKGNKVDAVVMDYLPATKLVTKDMKILDTYLVSDSYGMIVKTGNVELLKVANEVINELKEKGKIEEFLNSYETKNNNKISTIKDKFYYSIIYDGRYKYILEGLKNTFLMALLSVIIGTIVGGMLAIIRNYHDSTNNLKILNKLAKIYITVIRGTPSILQLMIIYYVLFKSVDINIVLVGVIAFSINSSAYVAEIIRAGFNSTDIGQIEAGYALGLKYNHVMKYIILPPAIRNILPALGNEFITLVKETSVGAYIGIVELTKASDIIASGTYDYFFPLIIIALIYLLITFILSRLVNKLERRLSNARN